jgi:hypothetical protein
LRSRNRLIEKPQLTGLATAAVAAWWRSNRIATAYLFNFF